MAANNHVHLIGNLTREVEVRVTPKGTQIGSFSLAVNRRWADESGTLKEEVTFVDCEMWGKMVEPFAKYHPKGSKVAICGRLKLDSWEDKTSGQKRSKLKVVAESFEFVNSKPGAAGEGGDETRQQSAPARRPAAAPTASPEIEDDVPFKEPR